MSLSFPLVLPACQGFSDKFPCCCVSSSAALMFPYLAFPAAL